MLSTMRVGGGLCGLHAARHEMRDVSPFSILRPRNFSVGKESDTSPRCNAHSKRERLPQCPGENLFARIFCVFYFGSDARVQDINDDLHRACVRRLVRIPSWQPTHVDVQLLACFCSALIPLSSVDHSPLLC